MPLQQTQQIPQETAAPLSQSSARLSDTAEATHAVPNSTVAKFLEAAENAEQKRRMVSGIYHAMNNSIVVLFVGLLLMMAASVMGFVSPNLQKTIIVDYALVFTLNFFCTMVLKQHWLDRLDRAVYDATVKLLPATNEPSRLLPFVDSLRASQTTDERRQLYPALTELLWNLPASDATLLLDTTRRDALRTTLIGSYWIMVNFRRSASDGHFDDATADLAVAIMKTLAGIGDKKSVKVLQKIIGAEAKTPNDTVVRDAACEYLPVLTQKIAEEAAVRRNIWACLAEQIRNPQKVLIEYLDTLPAEVAKLALVNFLYHERQRSLMVRGAYFTAALCTAVFGAWLLLSGTLNNLPHSAGLSGGFGAIIGTVINLLYSGGRRYTFAKRTQKSVIELGNRAENDVRIIGTLLSFAQSGLDKQHIDAVTKAIARLLPLLQPGDAALVPPAQRAYLRSWLKLPQRKSKKGSGGGKGNTSQTLAILALNALATIGDTKALPAAEAIARRTTRGNYHEADLHEAALRCVDALRMRKG